MSVLPNGPDTTYLLSRNSLTGNRITAAELLLTGQNVVNQVGIDYIIFTDSLYAKQVALYDVNGNLLAAGTEACDRQSTGTQSDNFLLSSSVPVVSVATVWTLRGHLSGRTKVHAVMRQKFF